MWRLLQAQNTVVREEGSSVFREMAVRKWARSVRAAIPREPPAPREVQQKATCLSWCVATARSAPVKVWPSAPKPLFPDSIFANPKDFKGIRKNPAASLKWTGAISKQPLLVWQMKRRIHWPWEEFLRSNCPALRKQHLVGPEITYCHGRAGGTHAVSAVVAELRVLR